MEDVLYEIENIFHLVGFGSATEALPDETTILNAYYLLTLLQLTKKLFETINVYLKEQGLFVSQGTMVGCLLYSCIPTG